MARLSAPLALGRRLGKADRSYLTSWLGAQTNHEIAERRADLVGRVLLKVM
jgi:hypothetical protein